MRYLSALFAVLTASTVQASADIVSGATWTAVRKASTTDVSWRGANRLRLTPANMFKHMVTV